MMWFKRIQLGLIHTAVAIALVPFTSTLNRVMIVELGLPATLVTGLIIVPYLLGPAQVWIGSYADRHPLLGRRRSPYILIGLLIGVAGLFVAPYAAYDLAEAWPMGVPISVLSFAAWGIGYNLSAVSYLSLASELDPEGRGKTIATMFVMMVLGIIVTAVVLGRIIDPYTFEALVRGFYVVGGAALVMGLLGLIGLEPAFSTETLPTEERYPWGDMFRAIFQHKQARLFFWYLVVLLAAILGQDVILEAFGGEGLGLTPAQTTRINSIWGAGALLTMVLSGWLQSRFGKRRVAVWGAWMALAAFVLLALSGILEQTGLFYLAVTLLGLGTGFATVANLSLMLDMTLVGQVGLYIGAWGMANAISRLTGQLLSGIARDALSRLFTQPSLPYIIVFLIEGAFLGISLLLLRSISVDNFKTQTAASADIIENAALVFEATD